MENGSDEMVVNIPWAIITLQNELMKHGDLYDAFIASINGAIEDIKHAGKLNPAEHILKRVIGEE